MGIKAILCAVFILLTNPVAAHAICRGAYLSGVRLWEGSVEDAFAERASQIRQEQAQVQHRSEEREKTEAS
jgi:multicomponent Na+:H+ antiporter subunit G